MCYEVCPDNTFTINATKCSASGELCLNCVENPNKCTSCLVNKVLFDY
jgi:hypothetical protein